MTSPFLLTFGCRCSSIMGLLALLSAACSKDNTVIAGEGKGSYEMDCATVCAAMIANPVQGGQAPFACPGDGTSGAQGNCEAFCAAEILCVNEEAASKADECGQLLSELLYCTSKVPASSLNWQCDSNGRTVQLGSGCAQQGSDYFKCVGAVTDFPSRTRFCSP